MSEQTNHVRQGSRWGLLAAGLVVLHLLGWLLWPGPEPGAFYIYTSPSGAEVFVQRIDLAGLHTVPVGKTPGPLRLSQQEGLDSRYLFKLAGYYDLEKEVPRGAFGPSSPRFPARGKLALKPRIPVLIPAYYWGRHNPLLLLALLAAALAGRSGYTGWRSERKRAQQLDEIASGQVEVGSRLDGYEVERGLGIGGMARVYLVRKPGDPVPAALKLLSRRLSQSQEFVSRFRREIKIYRELDHPNIVKLYDWGTVADQHYLVSEYVEGEPLSARLGQATSPRQAFEWAVQLADALAYAHARGIVHRDIKPSNVMVTGSKVKLMDFGIALLADEDRLTQAGDA
ncbi:MAG: serine/threonine protein kinase, partial [Candidatus Eremiobacteraeota bacterium]|nr:serine/threonine protein kinase [Candidatus Eremiobacteraeota bacterium]